MWARPPTVSRWFSINSHAGRSVSCCSRIYFIRFYSVNVTTTIISRYLSGRLYDESYDPRWKVFHRPRERLACRLNALDPANGSIYVPYVSPACHILSSLQPRKPHQKPVFDGCSQHADYTKCGGDAPAIFSFQTQLAFLAVIVFLAFANEHATRSEMATQVDDKLKIRSSPSDVSNKELLRRKERGS